MANRGKTYDAQVCSIKDLERLGSAKMLKVNREYYNEGAMDLHTLHENESAYDRYKIRPRVLRGVSEIDTSTEIFGVTDREALLPGLAAVGQRAMQLTHVRVSSHFT
ncbi:hypothetical protein Q7P37_008701 [Cladosporium fusiforme]